MVQDPIVSPFSRHFTPNGTPQTLQNLDMESEVKGKAIQLQAWTGP
jgi:hypothetical protein